MEAVPRCAACNEYFVKIRQGECKVYHIVLLTWYFHNMWLVLFTVTLSKTEPLLIVSPQLDGVLIFFMSLLRLIMWLAGTWLPYTLQSNGFMLWIYGLLSKNLMNLMALCCLNNFYHDFKLKSLRYSKLFDIWKSCFLHLYTKNIIIFLSQVQTPCVPFLTRALDDITEANCTFQ